MSEVMNVGVMNVGQSVYTGLNAQKLKVDGWVMGMEISVSTSSKSTSLRC